MNKLLLTSICAVGISASAFAQGTLNWGAIIPTYMTAQTNSTAYSSFFGGGSTGSGAVGATSATAGSFYYALLWTSGTVTPPTSLAGLGSWTDSGLSAGNSTTAGRLSPTPSNTGAAVTGWAAGVANNLMVVGWSANLGTTWSQALANLQSSTALGSLGGNAFFGISSLGNVTASAGNPGTTIFGTGAGQINSPNTQLYLVPVPEPGTMALAALGGASLFLFRRRK